MKFLKSFISSEKNDLHQIIKIVYSIMMLMILGICLCFQHINYARIKEFFINNIWAIPSGILILSGIYFAVKKMIKQNRPRLEKMVLLILGAVLLALQFFSVWNYYFYTDWDVETLIQNSYAVVDRNEEILSGGYFSMYPNNLLLVFIFSAIIRGSRIIGLGEHSYLMILFVQCIISVVTGILLFFVLKKILRSSIAAWTGWILYLLTVGISPWVSIPYSDSVGLLFPTLIFFVYCHISQTSLKYAIIKYFIIGGLCVTAYQIKPQTVIIVIALLGVEILRIHRKAVKKYFVAGIGFLIGMVIAMNLLNFADNSLGITVDKEKSFGLTHFLMLGANEDAMGVWNEKDVQISGECKTAEERKQINLEEFSKRIQSMGFIGTIKQAVRKTLTNYNDGTFCWGGEGVFYREIIPERNNPVCSILRSLYYNRGISDSFIYYEFFAQIIWMGILTFSLFGCFGKRTKYESTVLLAIIGLTVFETVFEARARYLFTYIPMYIIAALVGVYSLNEKVKSWLENHENIFSRTVQGMRKRGIE